MDRLNSDAIGFDMGCGSGRWARWVAPRVSRLHCIDPSGALKIAARNLKRFENISYHKASVEEAVLPEASQDFGYSLGVLHHVPDTEQAIRSCVTFLKPGAPLLLYLYYAFDNRPWWFRAIWRASDLLRRGISACPAFLKNIICDLIAALVYWPLARTSGLIEKYGGKVESLPLNYYREHSFYTMRTDSRDRFGTPLEHRFSRAEICSMMESAGLQDIEFSDRPPYWCAVGFRKT